VGNMYNQIKELKLEVDSLNHKKECKDLSAVELTRSNIIASRLRNLYRMQKFVWHQKSRV